MTGRFPSIGLASIPLLWGALLFSSGVFAQSTQPFADGTRIQFPANHGYWLVRNSAGVELCQGNSSNGTSNNYQTSGRCENLASGTYNVENLSTAGTADDTQVTIGGGNGGGNSDPVDQATQPFADGARIQFPANFGYWLVRNSAGAEICQGNSANGTSNNYQTNGSCENLANGTYTFENLSSPGTADDGEITIGDGSGGSGSGSGPVDQSSPSAFDLRLSGRTLIWSVANSIVDAEGFGFQLTQTQFDNNDRVDANSISQFRNRRWTHAGSAHTLTSLYTTARGTESTEFRFDLSSLTAWIPGTVFDVQTYSSTGAFTSYRGVLRKPTIPATGNPQLIGDFLSTFGTGANSTSSLEGGFIGTRSDWSETPDFDEEFFPIYQNNESGDQQLRVRNGRLTNTSPQAWRWYFGRDSSNGITPSTDRDDTMDNNHAVLSADGILEMELETTSDTTARYSYLGTDNDDGDARNQPTNGYRIDPTGGVFIEASVRLNEATPAAQAWWAVWLMARGGTEYNCDASDGSEVDIFEMVPDQNNGFNAKLFRGLDDCNGNGGDLGLNGADGNPLGFTYEGPQMANLPTELRNIPNYMDGNFHRIGMYYDEEKYAFYIDNKMFYELPINQADWVTTDQALSIRLTWELQQVLGRINTNDPNNPYTIVNPWNRNVPDGSGGGVHGDMIRTGNPTVYIDWVKVWKKTTAFSGLTLTCNGYEITETSAGVFDAPGFSGNVIVGTDGADELQGTSGADLIVGRSGNDVIIGGAGNDVICSDDGADTVTGGNGQDIISGGRGGDSISGGNGRDTITGDNGLDTISGGRGVDTIEGGRGNDNITGRRGNDTIYGGLGKDTISGGAGNDAIYGDNANDALNGGSGTDLCVGGAGAGDTFTNCEQ